MPNPIHPLVTTRNRSFLHPSSSKIFLAGSQNLNENLDLGLVTQTI